MRHEHAPTRLVSYLPLVIGACVWVALGSAAIKWPARDTIEYANNRARLERLTSDQRRKIWDKYHEFLSLSRQDRQRIRRLHEDLQKLPSEKRDRYRALMDRYKKWMDSLPLYQRQRLEDAAIQGASSLYAAMREAEKEEERADRQRSYWFLPDNPAVRQAVPKILARLTPEEIDHLDQTSPLQRTEKLFAHAQQLGIEPPVGIGAGRPRMRGPLPEPDPEKFREFMLRLSREQLEELTDLGFMKAMRNRRARELYYLLNPDEYRERMRRREGAPGPSSGDRASGERDESEPRPRAKNREPTKKGGTIKIPSSEP